MQDRIAIARDAFAKCTYLTGDQLNVLSAPFAMQLRKAQKMPIMSSHVLTIGLQGGYAEEFAANPNKEPPEWMGIGRLVVLRRIWFQLWKQFGARVSKELRHFRGVLGPKKTSKKSIKSSQKKRRRGKRGACEKGRRTRLMDTLKSKNIRFKATNGQMELKTLVQLVYGSFSEEDIFHASKNLP